LVRRDTATADGTAPMPRGAWAINADGSDLHQVSGADDVAAMLGIAVDGTACCFHGDGHPLDVSDDGSQLVFGAFGGDGEHVFAVERDGSNLRLLRESVQWVLRVAISGDGATVAYDVMLPDTDKNEVAVVPATGGESTKLPGVPYAGFEEPLQLTPDGSVLLVSPNALLIDTTTAEAMLLATSINGAGGNYEAVLTDGLARVTMDAEARRFLYVMRTVRCADCANLQEQLATLDIDPASMGEAPEITGGSIEPGSIDLEYGSEAMVEAVVESENSVLGVGFAALVDGVVDVNVGSGRVLLDDGQNGDSVSNDGVYTAGGIVHGYVVARENDIGPRTIRLAAEVEGRDGLRHATALDVGTLTVGPEIQRIATPSPTG
ncbi:MAG: TolB family protein, partial [Thermomicrobiales bacterium]